MNLINTIILFQTIFFRRKNHLHHAMKNQNYLKKNPRKILKSMNLTTIHYYKIFRRLRKNFWNNCYCFFPCCFLMEQNSSGNSCKNLIAIDYSVYNYSLKIHFFSDKYYLKNCFLRYYWNSGRNLMVFLQHLSYYKFCWYCHYCYG